MNRIVINGVTISAGRNITITGNRVLVDGADVTPDAKVVTIEVAGNVEKIEADCCERISVTGDAGIVKTQSGNVDVHGGVSGSVQTMSGDVECGGAIGGGVSTMSGDIRHR